MIKGEPWYRNALASGLAQIGEELLRDPHNRELIQRFLMEVERSGPGSMSFSVLERYAQAVPEPSGLTHGEDLWKALWASAKAVKKLPDVHIYWVFGSKVGPRVGYQDVVPRFPIYTTVEGSIDDTVQGSLDTTHVLNLLDLVQLLTDLKEEYSNFSVDPEGISLITFPRVDEFNYDDEAWKVLESLGFSNPHLILDRIETPRPAVEDESPPTQELFYQISPSPNNPFASSWPIVLRWVRDWKTR